MENNNQVINSEPIKQIKSFYPTSWIFYITFFLGPLGGLYLMYHNFKNLNEHRYAKNTIIAGVISILLLAIIMFIFLLLDLLYENNLPFPQYILPLLYTGIIYSFAQNLQNEKVKKFLEEDSKKENLLKAIGIGLLLLLVTVTVLLLLVLPPVFFLLFMIEIITIN